MLVARAFGQSERNQCSRFRRARVTPDEDVVDLVRHACFLIERPSMTSMPSIGA
jgi:hypothetical protein